MKISLKQKKDINILSISGKISSKNIAVLRVGITKLLKEGKNNIILSFKNIEKQQDAIKGIIKAIINLETMLKELNGKIVLNGLSKDILNKISSIQTENKIENFDKINRAIESFDQKEKRYSDIEKDKLIKRLKKRIEELEKDIDKKFNKKIKELESIVHNLQERIVTFLEERRIPPNHESYKKNIETLEKTISEINIK